MRSKSIDPTNPLSLCIKLLFLSNAPSTRPDRNFAQVTVGLWKDILAHELWTTCLKDSRSQVHEQVFLVFFCIAFAGQGCRQRDASCQVRHRCHDAWESQVEFIYLAIRAVFQGTAGCRTENHKLTHILTSSLVNCNNSKYTVNRLITKCMRDFRTPGMQTLRPALFLAFFLPPTLSHSSTRTHLLREQILLITCDAQFISAAK